jgi:hypothetical protein
MIKGARVMHRSRLSMRVWGEVRVKKVFYIRRLPQKMVFNTKWAASSFSPEIFAHIF